MLRPFKPLRGGAYLHDDPCDAVPRDFRPLPGRAPTRLRVPLAHFHEPPARALVSPGDAVGHGQQIARGDDGSGWHAPVAGVVNALLEVATPYAARVPAIEIVADPNGPDRPVELFEGAFTAEAATRREFVRIAREAGANASPLADFVDGPGPRAVIICGLDAAPPQSCRTELVLRYCPAIIETATIIHRLFDVHRTFLAVDRAHHTLVRVCQQRTHRAPVRVADLVNKYPQAHATALIRTIMRRAIQPGGTPREVGAVVLDVSDLVDYARALRGEPVTHRLITVAGQAVPEPGNYRVPIGMTVGGVLSAVGVTNRGGIAIDCPLTGVTPDADDRVITRQTSAIIPLSPVHPAQPAACIRCGLCQDYCPVELDPRALYLLADRQRWLESRRRHPRACLGCGLCDYVCPSELPLMHSVLACRDARDAR